MPVFSTWDRARLVFSENAVAAVRYETIGRLADALGDQPRNHQESPRSSQLPNRPKRRFRSFSHGLALLMNYTFSHATDSGGAGISTYGNQANTRAMYTYNLRLEHARRLVYCQQWGAARTV